MTYLIQSSNSSTNTTNKPSSGRKILFSWLSALPIQKDHFDLTANEFRDALWELRKVEVVPIVVGALGAVTENIEKWIKNLGITVRLEHLQKTALLGTARIIRRHLNTEN